MLFINLVVMEWVRWEVGSVCTGDYESGIKLDASEFEREACGTVICILASKFRFISQVLSCDSQ